MSPVGQNEVVTRGRNLAEEKHTKVDDKGRKQNVNVCDPEETSSAMSRLIVMNVLKSWMAADKHSASKPFVRMARAGEHHAYHNK